MNLIDYFNKGMTFEEYKELLDDQKAVFELHYKKAQTDNRLSKIPQLKIVVLTKPPCGDSTAIIPVIQKLFEDQQAEIRFLERDEHPDLMDQFLTNGTRSIPIVIVSNEVGEYMFHFGPRPKEAQEIYEQYRPDIEAGKIEKPEVTKKIRTFYSKNRGKAILDEFLFKLAEATK